MIQPAKRATGYGLQTVWSTFTPLAISSKAVNLGQGFPDLPPADFVKNAVIEAVMEDAVNQYAPSRGRPSLLAELARDYSVDMRRALSSENVLVTLGANQGIFVALQTFVDPGDRVLLIEPYFDIYKPSVNIVGGQVVTVKLEYREDDWVIDFETLESTIAEHKVKVLLLNTPHNPTGKIFSVQELQEIARLSIKHDLLVISDEVYDELYYTETRPIRLASLPGMWERCLTVGSAGKRFGVTGWRIGWIVGDTTLLNSVLSVHSRTVFSAPSPLQEACARSLSIAAQSGYFEEMRALLRRKRDMLMKTLEEVGMRCWTPQGGYFIMAKSDKIVEKIQDTEKRPWAEFPGLTEPEDYDRARWMTEHVGVACIPPSAFYEHENLGDARDWLRFCFCKRDDTLEEAVRRLRERCT
jgi:aspartate/methionine/tyrosine aminotransferase